MAETIFSAYVTVCVCWQCMCCCVGVCCLLTDVIKHQVTYLLVCDTDQHSVPLCVCVCCLCWQKTAQCSCLCMCYMCVLSVDRDQHSVPVPKQLHQPFWTPEWGRDKAECAELPGLPEGWHTTHHQPWTQGKLTWPGLPDWLITNPGHKVNWPHLPYWRMAHNSSPTLGLKVNWLKLVYLKDTWLITSPGFR